MSLYIRFLIRNFKIIFILLVFCIYVWENGAKRVKMFIIKSFVLFIRVSLNVKFILFVFIVICLYYLIINEV